jgi:hypothetical protein
MNKFICTCLNLKFLQHLYLLPICLLLIGCGAMDKNQVANVHQAWGSRYHYDLDNRRMVSMYDDKKVGRVRGRDMNGRIDYDRYWVMKPFKGENLLKYHNARLDNLRESRWEEANEVLIEARRLKLSEIATLEEEGVKETEENTDESLIGEDDFVPAPFIPQGIDMPSLEPSEDQSLPMMQQGLPPANDAMAVPPSPFAPLPPL